MYIKPITYTDFNDVERTENFYFNLTKAELLEMELLSDGGMEATIEKIINEHDNKKMVGVNL